VVDETDQERGQSIPVAVGGQAVGEFFDALGEPLLGGLRGWGGGVHAVLLVFLTFHVKRKFPQAVAMAERLARLTGFWGSTTFVPRPCRGRERTPLRRALLASRGDPQTLVRRIDVRGRKKIRAAIGRPQEA
jgi:hypothetical protein